MSVSCAAGSLRAGSTLLVVNGLVEIDENMRWTIIKGSKDWSREMVEFANAHEDCLKKSLHSNGVSKLKHLFQSVFSSACSLCFSEDELVSFDKIYSDAKYDPYM